MLNIHFPTGLFPPILSEYKPFVLLDSATYLLLFGTAFSENPQIAKSAAHLFSLYAAIPFLQAVSMPSI